MTPRPAAMASAYTDAKLTTASPQRLLVMLYDRLVLDLERAEEHLRSGRSGHTDLVHAQDIVMELLTSLDTSVWAGAPGLSALYTYLHTQLVTANVRNDADLVADARSHVEPLRDAWRQAAGAAAPPAPGRGAALAAAALAAGAATVALTDPRPAAASDVRAPLSVTA